MGDDVATHGRLVLEVEVLQGLAGRETGRPDARLPAVALPRRDLALETRDEVLLMAPGLRAAASRSEGAFRARHR